MGRLIDADALIETMKKVETEYEDSMTCPSWWTAYSVISEQPTAYDVEKVLKQLKEAETDVDNLGTYAIPTDEAIKIALKGGINE